ncbi:MAG TPA: hypothetical protein VFD84_06695 [Candidatus Binatia bacterium]|nr:hypothetical protein [Candidatus Binatia bacterium]
MQRLAQQADEQKEAFEWGAYQVVAGALGTLHFVSSAPDWATFAAREPIEVLVRRILGDTGGAQLLEELGQCIVAERYVIGRDRLDLSCPPPENAAHTAMATVATLQAKPGGEDACEELIRKVAQAIPQVSDPRRMMACQTFIGDPRVYWIVTPLADVADLDRMLPIEELLMKAFGAEGTLIHRTALAAIERFERHMTMFRPELSHASWAGSVIGLPSQRAAAARPAVH